jgi:hypothetical protein
VALLAIESAISFPGWPEWLGIKKNYICAVFSQDFYYRREWFGGFSGRGWSRSSKYGFGVGRDFVVLRGKWAC